MTKYFRTTIVISALTVFLLMGSGCQQVPLATLSSPGDSGRANTGPAVSATPTGTAPTDAGLAEANPAKGQAPAPSGFDPALAISNPLIVRAFGQAVTEDVFSQPMLTLFFIVENIAETPQAMLRADAVLYGANGRQLGTRSWGSRPIIIPPDTAVPIAFTYDGSDWQKANVTIPKYRHDSNKEAYDGLAVTGSALVSERQNTVITGAIQNVGPLTAYDITAIVVGYDRSNSMVAWGYSYPSQAPLHSGRSTPVEFSRLQGNIDEIASYEFYIYGQRGKTERTEDLLVQYARASTR